MQHPNVAAVGKRAAPKNRKEFNLKLKFKVIFLFLDERIISPVPAVVAPDVSKSPLAVTVQQIRQ